MQPLKPSAPRRIKSVAGKALFLTFAGTLALIVGSLCGLTPALTALGAVLFVIVCAAADVRRRTHPRYSPLPRCGADHTPR